MRFWDTSAVVPLFVRQSSTARVRELLRADHEMCVWWATPVETWSALGRLRRQQLISAADEDKAGRELDVLRETWHEISPSEAVRNQARRLISVHELRAADAMQLAAALVWASYSGDHEFVSFDQRLREAARREGFQLI